MLFFVLNKRILPLHSVQKRSDLNQAKRGLGSCIDWGVEK